jgi:hypothetical protein
MDKHIYVNTGIKGPINLLNSDDSFSNYIWSCGYYDNNLIYEAVYSVFKTFGNYEFRAR